MQHLLNLFAAIALLVWGTHIVRSGILRVFGAELREALGSHADNHLAMAGVGVGVTALLQSSTATGLMVSSFVGQGIMSLSAALAALRGADVGTALMVMVFSFDLSWLSPLLLLTGIVLYLSREGTSAGRIGSVLIGLGIITLALRLIGEATAPLVQAPETGMLLRAVTGDTALELFIGALLAVLAYSSLAAVLLIAALAASSVLPITAALGLVLGANLGTAILAILNTLKSPLAARRVQVGNFIFKAAGCVIVAILLQPIEGLLGRWGWLNHAAMAVVFFHLVFNGLNAVAFLPLTGRMAQWLNRWMPQPQNPLEDTGPRHLDTSALGTPSLAISCAAREALHQADVVETMLVGVVPVIQNNDLKLSGQLRKLDDQVDTLYSAIKYYMTQISRASLDEREGRRWADILSFTINMEQIGDIIERVLIDVENKKIRPGRAFSEAGMKEILDLHEHLLENLRLSMSVFLNGNIRDAERLLQQKTLFRELEHTYANTHFERLHGKLTGSMETSSLHIDLINELKRVNSHICSVAYPILEAAGVLAPNRLIGSAAGIQANDAHLPEAGGDTAPTNAPKRGTASGSSKRNRRDGLQNA